MDGDKIEIECPVCDRKVSADAKKCPGCGAEFYLSGVDELDDLAKHLAEEPRSEEGQTSITSVTIQEGSVENVKDPLKEDPPAQTNAAAKKEGLLKRLFGTKK